MTEYLVGIGILFGVYAILAVSLNVINGYCGLFSLGHAGFAAVGAYTAAAASKFWFPEFVAANPNLGLLLVCLIAMVAAGVIGFAVGFPCLRLTGDYLAIATVGFGEIIRIVIMNMEAVGAQTGLTDIPRLTRIWHVALALALTLWILSNLIKSSFGRNIIAIREDEIAASAMGVNVRRYKTFSFVVGALFAGLAGALFAHQQQFLHPNNFVFMVSVTILLMIVIGGLGSQTGAVLGAFLVTLLPEVLRFNETLSQNRMLFFSALLVIIMLWQPSGLVGFVRERFAKKRQLA